MYIEELYEKGKEYFKNQKFGNLLNYVETGYIKSNNRRILDQYFLKQRCVDAQEADTHCSILGIKLSTPIVMSAMTMPISAISDGSMEQVARGLKQIGSLMWTGTPVPDNLSDVADTGVPLAANVKPYRDRGKMYFEIEKVLECKVNWLGLEIDAGQGTKIKDKEMGFDCAPLSSREIAKVRQKSPIPLVCKGVLSKEDAVKCVDAGADLLVISNHGGHTLDYMPHPFQVMQEIREAVGNKVELMVDGGFRRGSDVLKGLAFGASLVGLGRPVLYALAADGKKGVQDLLLQLTQELIRLMTMVGAESLSKVDHSILIKSKSTCHY